MTTPQKPQIYHKYQTPVKSVKDKQCIVCGKAPVGHLRPINKNAVLKTVYLELLTILDVDILQLEPYIKVICICDSCIGLKSKINELKIVCREQINKLSNQNSETEDRFKRVIIHSKSPAHKKRSISKNNTVIITDSEKVPVKCLPKSLSRKSLKFPQASTPDLDYPGLVNRTSPFSSSSTPTDHNISSSVNRLSPFPSSSTPAADHGYSGRVNRPSPFPSSSTETDHDYSSSVNRTSPFPSSSTETDHDYSGRVNRPSPFPSSSTETDHDYSSSVNRTSPFPSSSTETDHDYSGSVNRSSPFPSSSTETDHDYSSSMNRPSPFPSSSTPATDHDYSTGKKSASIITPRNTVIHHEYSHASSGTVFNQHKMVRKISEEKEMTLCERLALKSLINTSNDRSARDISLKLMDLPTVSQSIKNIILQEINCSLDYICSVNGSSVLRSPVNKLTDPAFLSKIITEMEQKCPLVLDILVTLCCSVERSLPEDNFIVAALYAAAMHSRNNHLCAFQKMIAASCIRFHAGNGLLNGLTSLHLSIAESSKYAFLDEVGRMVGEGVIKALSTRRHIKVTVDNIDGRILANQVRLNSGNRDYHYTHWTVMVSRATEDDLAHLSEEPKTVPIDGPDPSVYFLDVSEHAKLRESYKWMLCKILVEEIPSLAIFKKTLTGEMPQDYSHIVDKPSDIYPMFVIMKDPKTLPNCVLIMDKILDTLKSYYTAAGREKDFEQAKIPLGGDQLTRVCFDSAKNLRAGTHTPTQRLEQLYPVIEELFHVEQDLLEKIVKKFYNTESSREEGTLAHLKALLHRKNVNGEVKSTTGFEPHRDFVFTVLRALLVEKTCEVLNLKDKYDTPVLPDNLKFWKTEKKRNWLFSLVEPVVEAIYVDFKAPSMDAVNMRIETVNGAFDIVAPAHLRGKHIDMLLQGRMVRIPVPGENHPPKPDDDLYNYSLSFLRGAMDLLQLDDLIRAGDIDRLTIMMKRLIPTFISLTSYRSKYAIECVNFITKTECILSEKDSVSVRLGAFVNTTGKSGHNKAADMQQENNIKMVKTVLRGLGAGKTDKAMERVSKSAPVLTSIADNLEVMTGTKQKAGKHVDKSSAGDIDVLSQHFRHIRPFKKTEGRQLDSFSDVNPNLFESIDKYKLREFMCRHGRRTSTNMAIENDLD